MAAEKAQQARVSAEEMLFEVESAID